MIEIVNAEQLSNATARAKEGNLFVQPTTFVRQYKVTNRENGNQYYIDFFVRNGKRYGQCTCKAGMNNKLCKHLSVSAGYHVMRMAVRREANRIATLPIAA